MLFRAWGIAHRVMAERKTEIEGDGEKGRLGETGMRGRLGDLEIG
jgi:hypothetical protein